jgi:hypothetical protein
MGSDRVELITDLDIAEQEFFDPALLETQFARLYREAYITNRNTIWLNPFRNYRKLLDDFSELAAYNLEHARALAKRIKAQAADWRSCEAVVAELIVYRAQLPLIGEGHLRSVDLQNEECDLVVTRRDGSQSFLEVFCIMPDLKRAEDGLVNVQTHTQEALSSARQKLLRKITEQGQMSSVRENWAVIELNDIRIAGDFTVLSSLSDGYKVALERSTLEVVRSGYDWSRSVFDDEATRNLAGVVYFSLGDYASRRVLPNPRFRRA